MPKLLYSNNRASRVTRHVLFWLILYLMEYTTSLIFMYPRYLFQGDIKVLFLQWDLNTAYFLVDVLYSYIIIYYVYPRVQRDKNMMFFILQSVVFLLPAFIVKCLINYGLKETWNGHSVSYVYIVWLTFISFLNFGPPVKCALLFSCKLLKDYHLKMARLNKLVVETSEAELQLLKSQVHPHFLFNTLNNIYATLIMKKMDAAALILKLRNTIFYMINDCQSPVVPLLKEIDMIYDYIALEKIRYGQRLDVRINASGDFGDRMIAPLLIVPVVENCFKHGSSQTTEKAWISIDMRVDGEMIYINVENSRPVSVHSSSAGGIGLANVQKRMKLLFGKAGEIKVMPAARSFKVAFAIPLYRNNPAVAYEYSELAKNGLTDGE